MGDKRVFNYSAGPGVMPEDVLRQIQQDVWNIAGSGIGILEHSHRGKVFDKVLSEAEAALRQVGSVPANYRILFMTGGASAQNYLIPANLMPPTGGVADYINTGYWATRSVDEGRFYGTIHEAASSADTNHSYIPSQASLKWSGKASYAHYTSNNTIYGTQFHYVPQTPADVPLCCDMCSDIYSRPVDISKFGLIYAGAQKNLGPAGTTVVIVRDDLVEKGNKNLPKYLQYRTYAKDESRPNTPPVFAIYCVGLVAKWILKEGGLKEMERRNAEKAAIVYNAIDASKFYRGHARQDSRSLMNLTFRTPSDALDEMFCAEAQKAGLDTLKGHRATGGMRASLYNAMPKAGAEALAQFMKEFERVRG